MTNRHIEADQAEIPQRFQGVARGEQVLARTDRSWRVLNVLAVCCPVRAREPAGSAGRPTRKLILAGFTFHLAHIDGRPIRQQGRDQSPLAALRAPTKTQPACSKTSARSVISVAGRRSAEEGHGVEAGERPGEFGGGRGGAGSSRYDGGGRVGPKPPAVRPVEMRQLPTFGQCRKADMSERLSSAVSSDPLRTSQNHARSGNPKTDNCHYGAMFGGRPTRA